jgi:formylglycine-generating enzyme required for sulfatase activity
LRGGSWANAQPELLWTSYRNLVKPAMREPIFGFRVAISVTLAQPADPSLSEP